MSRGWYRESYRHRLAAQGVSTRRYMAPNFQRAAESLKKFASDREDAPSSVEAMRTRHVDDARNEYIDKFRKLEQQKLIEPKNSDFFMEHEFDTEVQNYLKKITDRHQFDEAVERRFKLFTKIHGKRLPLFDFTGDVHGI